MKVGILGSGMVGQTIGAKLDEHEVDVVLGTRTPEQLDEKRGMGASLSEWLAKVGKRGRLGTFADAAAHGELIINATSGAGSLQADIGGSVSLPGPLLPGSFMLRAAARPLPTGVSG